MGGVTAFLLLFGEAYLRRMRFLKNSNPDWSKPGKIALGDFYRFQTAVRQVFPTSPARSYVSIFSYNDHPYQVEQTVFFVRSAGKRKGKHSFVGELRLSSSDRDHAMDAIPYLEQTVGPLEREDKSYGLLVLKTAKQDGLDQLLDVAWEFSERVLGGRSGRPLSISWHISGRNL